jgi:hypothetical protein
VGRILPEKLEGGIDENLLNDGVRSQYVSHMQYMEGAYEVVVLHLNDVSSGNGRASTGNEDGSREGKNHREECEKK